MKREPINSTALATAGYDPETSTLEVEFRSGGIWQYHPVPADVLARMKDAAHSAGRIFFAEVKHNPAVTATKIVEIETAFESNGAEVMQQLSDSMRMLGVPT